MIERVFNEDLKQFVYQIKKSDFMRGLKKQVAEDAWNSVADKDFVAVDFDKYENASQFAKMLVNRYSVIL